MPSQTSVALDLRTRLTMIAETLDNIADLLPEGSEPRLALSDEIECLFMTAEELR